MTVDEIVAEVDRNGHRTVLVTGGEPLLQRAVEELLATLVDAGKRVLLETSGTLMPENALPLQEVPAGVHRVVDIKPPDSGIPAQAIDWEGIANLGQDDEIKIVCAGRRDYEWARDLISTADRLPAGVRVALSPVQDGLPARDLAEWILADRLDVCFQIQLHKAVWPDRERGV
jgi:7-carboxy-7-deazaguanine synthase